MTRARDLPCPREPLGLSMEHAAAYLGISLSLFLRMVADGRMPRPRRADGRRIWDADEIAAAFRSLPRDGPDVELAEEDVIRL